MVPNAGKQRFIAHHDLQVGSAMASPWASSFGEPLVSKIPERMDACQGLRNASVGLSDKSTKARARGQLDC